MDNNSEPGSDIPLNPTFSELFDRYVASKEESTEATRVMNLDPRTLQIIGGSVKTNKQEPASYPAVGMNYSDPQSELNCLRRHSHDFKADNEELVGNFCCGGRVAIQEPVNIISWRGRPGKTKKSLIFPNDSNLGMLRKDCRRTPGPHHSIRTLKRYEFSTNFDPHKVGIVAAIQQIMLPLVVHKHRKYEDRPYYYNTDGSTNKGHGAVGVKASLAALEIRSGKEVCWHAEREPHKPYHFGSLLVVLPQSIPWRGGNLRVFHNSGERPNSFEWTTHASSDIQWAAVYNNSPYEYEKILSGHQVVLIYSLYRTTYHGGRTSPYREIIDPMNHPLYEGCMLRFRVKNFMPNGGTLGFYCNYYYGHAHDENYRKCRQYDSLPESFRGIDFVFYNSFRKMAASFGLTISIRFILEDDITTAKLEEKYQIPEILAPTSQDEDVVAPEHMLQFSRVYRSDSFEQHTDIVRLQYDSKKIMWLNERARHLEPLSYAHARRRERRDTRQPPIPAYDNLFNIQWPNLAILVEVPEWNERNRSNLSTPLN